MGLGVKANVVFIFAWPKCAIICFEIIQGCYTAIRCFIVCQSFKLYIDDFNKRCMMAWPGELDQQARQGWRSLFAKKRADLSFSVQETLADGILEENLVSDESGELEEGVQGNSSSMVIPPRLSLQSKQIPVVGVEPEEAKSVVVADTRSTTGPVEVSQIEPKKQRLAGRTTKVHLQAVARPEKKSSRKISIQADKNERTTDGEVQASVQDDAKRSSTHEAEALIEGQVKSTARGALAGSGVFEQGQREVMVANVHISETSVAVITLVGDPGPVVVKYISLKPRDGFTVHLSAPAEVQTPFNYVVLMGELF